MVGSLKKRNSRDVRIWSAGCSTGEEPYTIAILLREYFGKDHYLWDTDILATDISAKVLQQALSGHYPHDRVSNLPATYRSAYFRKSSEGSWVISKEIKRGLFSEDSTS